MTKLKGRGATEIGENYAKMLDISEPKKGLREEAKKKRNGSWAATGGGKFESPCHPLPPTRSIFEMRTSRRIVLTITPLYRTHTSFNLGKDNFDVACLCPCQNVASGRFKA